MILQIEEGAIFIADSHYPHHGREFMDILERLDKDEIQTPQLFLMGDNFDLLFGHNRYIQNFSIRAITLLQKLSQKLEIHYFEGNHDFVLRDIFPYINIYSRDEQPITFGLNSQKIALSHGDKYATGFGYNLYCKVLRNRYTLTLLRPLEKLIIDHRMQKLSQKNICHNFDRFEDRVEKIMSHYQEADMVIEGHFHQARTLGKYISLPALACDGRVGVIESSQMVFKKI